MKKILTIFILTAIVFSVSDAAMPMMKKAVKKAIAIKKLETKPVKKILKEGEEIPQMPEPEGLPRLGTIKPVPLVKPLPRAPMTFQKKTLLLLHPLEFGFSAGLLAGIPGAYAELRWNNPFTLEFASIKTGVMYADGKDTSGTERKHFLIFTDGVYRFVAASADNIGTYIGGGINYLAMTSGRVSGTVGGEVYLGLESKMSKGEYLYVEMGYGAVRTGFSPTYKGLGATVGFRAKI